MRERKYFLAYDGDTLAAAFDGYEDYTSTGELINVCKLGGYELKEVPVFVYEREKQLAEERDIKKLLG